MYVSVSWDSSSLLSVNHFLIDASIRFLGTGAKRIALDAKDRSPKRVRTIVFQTREASDISRSKGREPKGAHVERRSMVDNARLFFDGRCP